MNETYWEENARQKIAEMQEEAKQAALAKEAHHENNFSLRKMLGNTLISAGEKLAGEAKPGYEVRVTSYE
jgi:hypothetical protein